MLNASQVYQRVRKLAAFAQMAESDFRGAYYGQTFTPAAGVLTPMVARPFPSGAIILGIGASAHVPGVAATGQSGRNRQLFRINFAFTGGEALVIDGPVMADALLGGGDSDIFPARELVVVPTQIINCQVQNLTTGALTVDVVYHCLVYRSVG